LRDRPRQPRALREALTAALEIWTANPPLGAQAGCRLDSNRGQCNRSTARSAPALKSSRSSFVGAFPRHRYYRVSALCISAGLPMTGLKSEAAVELGRRLLQLLDPVPPGTDCQESAPKRSLIPPNLVVSYWRIPTESSNTVRTLAKNPSRPALPSLIVPTGWHCCRFLTPVTSCCRCRCHSQIWKESGKVIAARLHHAT
jgi:hypothetical protein